jgi:salicylate hydroxylase
MPGSGRTYVIAGAGIAGMTLALALAKFSATVVVLERSATIQEFGAGLQVSPNARYCLNQLGLSETLDRHGLEPEALDLYPQGGRSPLLSMELGPLMQERFGCAYSVMHRADLADALYKACRRFANIDLLFGVRNWDLVSHARGVTVAIDEGNGQSRTSRAHGFIGADGVHSQTRISALDGPPAQFRERIAWRALLPWESLAGRIAANRVSVFFGAGFHLVCYPLPHRGQVNLAMFLPGKVPEAGEQPEPRRPGPAVEAILAVAGRQWTAWPMYTVETSSWHRGNIGLVGDAAHAMLPFQAQGAAMGIEDAMTLAPLLVGTETAEEAFSRYEKLRLARVSRVAALSAQNGRIFHLPWPLSLARDAVMRLQGPRAHLDRLGWVYAHTASHDTGAAS